MGKFDKYKIDLKGMQTDSAKYEFVLDNLYFAHIDGPEVQGKSKCNFEREKNLSRFRIAFRPTEWYGYRVIVVWMIWNYRSVLLIN